jgi:hypothetical protein
LVLFKDLSLHSLIISRWNNLMNSHLRITTFTFPIYYMKTAGGATLGLTVQLIKAATSSFNMTTSFTAAPASSSMAKPYIGPYGDLVGGRMDLIFCLNPTLARYPDFSFTTPVYTTSLTFLTPRPSPVSTNWRAFIAPFTPPL